MTDYRFYAFFTASKQGKIGLTPVIDVFDSSGVPQVTGAATVEVGDGLYTYTHIDATSDDYIAVFKTTDITVDSQHVPSLASEQLSNLPDSIWDEDLASHSAAGSAGEALASTCSLGTGSVAWDYYVTEPDLVTPIADVTVRATTDIAGLNTIAIGITDAFGKVTFNLDPGTYYLWSYKVYVTFTNPDTEVVV